MTEPERIKNLEEQIALVGMLLGVDLSRLPTEESMKLKRFALDLYRLGHASGFKAGVDHATTAIAVVEPRRILGFAGDSRGIRGGFAGDSRGIRGQGFAETGRGSQHSLARLMRQLPDNWDSAGA